VNSPSFFAEGESYSYRKTYRKAILPISIQNLQSDIHIQPPFRHAQRSRPKTSRIRKGDQERKKRKCPLCGVLGHNTRTCTAGPGLDHGRGERARNWRVQEEFDDIMALDIEEMEWTVEDLLQAKTVNAGSGDKR
jgi:hypothetical protein